MSSEPMLPEEDLVRPVRRSGAVTAVAIVNFILGGLYVLCGLLVMIFGGVFAAMITGAINSNPQNVADPQAQQAAKAVGGVMGVAAVWAGVCMMIFAAPTIIAGIGVLNRRQWGRILTLILGALSGLGALLNLTGLPRSLPNIIVAGGYCALVYVILLKKEYAAEFR
ncbi:MAG: DUF2127 domain-containing protein [Planctomycetota bacterium]|nr:MAG: DUF2127 domain-containing protein [Planctomycetota bacterium]